MARRLVTIVVGVALVLLLVATQAFAKNVEIHVSGGQKGFTTALGNHGNVSAFVKSDSGHAFYRGTIEGTKLNLRCRPKFGMFDVTNRGADFPAAQGAVLIWAECLNKIDGELWTVDVTFIDYGEPGKNEDKVGWYITPPGGGSQLIDDGFIQSGNVQITHVKK